MFRKNSLVTHAGFQYIAYYNAASQVIIGKRKQGDANWDLAATQYKGNTYDAHNSISIVLDGMGYMHVSWDQHNSKLRYATSLEPGSLLLSDEKPMIGEQELNVTYPEFYTLPSGDLLFMYRSGESGRGNLVMNRYDVEDKKWIRLQDNLISGEKERSAYWQSCVDKKGTIHLSWVWRESSDVASNHDLCYAKSEDGGQTWQQSNGSVYDPPITMKSAETVAKIDQQRELINQTSMTTDSQGNPVIVSYWRPDDSDVPQYHLVSYNENSWNIDNTGFRNRPFSLTGVGTKAIPISRPQIVLSNDNYAHIIFRDEERGNAISIASKPLSHVEDWQVKDFHQGSFKAWEPTLDYALWNAKNELHLLVQDVEQIDGEGLANTNEKSIFVLEVGHLK